MVYPHKCTVTHQLQVERSTGKFAGRETNALPLFHATNLRHSVESLSYRVTLFV